MITKQKLLNVAILCVLMAHAGGAAAASTDDAPIPEISQGAEDPALLYEIYQGALERGEIEPELKVEAPTLPFLREVNSYIFEKSLGPSQLSEINSAVEGKGAVVSKNSWQCRDQTIACIGASAGLVVIEAEEAIRTAVCAAAALGRDENSPNISTDCLRIMSEGADVCANANDVCGIVRRPSVHNGNFIGSSNGTHHDALTCGTLGGSIQDTVTAMGAYTKFIAGKTRLTGIWMKCGINTPFGYAGYKPADASLGFAVCDINNLRQTFPNSLRLYQSGNDFVRGEISCDNMKNNGTAGDYTPKGFGAPRTTNWASSSCPEGKRIWGVKVVTKPTDNYIVGVNVLCY